MSTASNAIIWTNCREYTEQECRDSGFRDGRDGIRFYPCTEWELVEGDQVRGHRTLARITYEQGYKAGRINWKEFTGSFPASGSTHLDDRDVPENSTKNV